MRPARIVIFPIIVLLCGCVDPSSGAGTKADLPSDVDLKCIEVALRSTPGAGEVSQMQAAHAAAKENTYDWEYGGELGATLEIRRDSYGVHYLNTNVKMGRDKTRGKAFEPLMRRVNETIEKRCGVPISTHASMTGL